MKLGVPHFAPLIPILFIFGATASAQALVQPVTRSGAQALPPDVHASPDELVARLMSFDRTATARSRRRSARALKTGREGRRHPDAALDRTGSAPVEQTAHKQQCRSSCVDSSWPLHVQRRLGLSSRRHIEGPDDLRLAGPTKAKRAPSPERSPTQP